MDWRDWFFSTPLVTRSVMATVVVTFVFSPFFPLIIDGIQICPYYVLTRLQVWRLLTPVFYCRSIISLIFQLIIFNRLGVRKEQEQGTLRFGATFILYELLINSLMCASAILLSILHPNFLSPEYHARGGLLPLLFTLGTQKCLSNPNTQTTFLALTMPTIYFPLFLLGLFVLLGESLLEAGAAVAVGYCYHYGHLNSIFPTTEWLTEVEKHPLVHRFIASRRGYVDLEQAASNSLPVTAPPEGAQGVNEWSRFMRSTLGDGEATDGQGAAPGAPRAQFPGRGQPLGGSAGEVAHAPTVARPPWGPIPASAPAFSLGNQLPPASGGARSGDIPHSAGSDSPLCSLHCSLLSLAF
ncbi:hypothetical protein CYMTET_42566, partial [Cymbomonas tetramitiformis]